MCGSLCGCKLEFATGARGRGGKNRVLSDGYKSTSPGSQLVGAKLSEFVSASVIRVFALVPTTSPPHWMTSLLMNNEKGSKQNEHARKITRE